MEPEANTNMVGRLGLGNHVSLAVVDSAAAIFNPWRPILGQEFDFHYKNISKSFVSADFTFLYEK
jgi:hypothetical protein